MHSSCTQSAAACTVWCFQPAFGYFGWLFIYVAQAKEEIGRLNGEIEACQERIRQLELTLAKLDAR
jgi:hypothetical protein